MAATAKLFNHGRSQAVRLPKEFRFEGREVRVTKVGDRVILEPMTPAEAMPWSAIDQLGDLPSCRRAASNPNRRPIAWCSNLDSTAVATRCSTSVARRHAKSLTRRGPRRTPLCLMMVVYEEWGGGGGAESEEKRWCCSWGGGRGVWEGGGGVGGGGGGGGRVGAMGRGGVASY